MSPHPPAPSPNGEGEVSWGTGSHGNQNFRERKILKEVIYDKE